MSKRLAKTYDKYVVKRGATGTGKPSKNEDGTPVLGDKVKTNVVITPYKADILNQGWDNPNVPVTYYYKEVEEIEENEEKSEARLALEKEATDLGIKFRDNIGDQKLSEKIKLAKEQ
jgi:hypothetical protein